MNRPRIPSPREAVIREATLGGERTEYWRGAYYGFMAALAKDRGDQAIAALQAVVTRSDSVR